MGICAILILYRAFWEFPFGPTISKFFAVSRTLWKLLAAPYGNVAPYGNHTAFSKIHPCSGYFQYSEITGMHYKPLQPDRITFLGGLNVDLHRVWPSV